LFDVLQEHNILIPNADRAIWRAVVSGNGWENELTLIRIPVSKIWQNPMRQPDPFEGDISLVESEKATVARSSSNGQPQTKSEAANNLIHQDDLSETDFSASREIDDQHPNTQTQDGILKGRGLLAVVSAKEITPTANDIADPFIQWIRSNIAHKSIAVNQAKARLHIVDEGVLIVTPGIFQDYANSQLGLDWLKVQKAFLKRKWHVKAENGLNVHVYLAKGKNRTSKVNGILVSDMKILFGSAKIPQSNMYLSRQPS